MATQKKVIVVIDDDELMTALIQKAIEIDFDVKAYNDPMLAIEELSSVMPAAILLDVNMPSIDGMEVMKQIKRHPQTAGIPFICISGDGGLAVREKLDEYGAIGFIKKPIDIKTLNGYIKSYLGSVNKTITSDDGNHSCTINYSTVEKYHLIIEKIMRALDRNEKVVFITWRSPDELDGKKLSPFIESEQLIWMEIKPIANIKMPYLTDLSPIIDDIDKIVPGELNEYHLFFDDLKNLFNLQDKQRTVSKTAEFSRLLRLVFTKTSHFIVRPNQQEEVNTVMKMVQLLIGIGA